MKHLKIIYLLGSAEVKGYDEEIARAEDMTGPADHVSPDATHNLSRESSHAGVTQPEQPEKSEIEINEDAPPHQDKLPLVIWSKRRVKKRKSTAKNTEPQEQAQDTEETVQKEEWVQEEKEQSKGEENVEEEAVENEVGSDTITPLESKFKPEGLDKVEVKVVHKADVDRNASEPQKDDIQKARLAFRMANLGKNDPSIHPDQENYYTPGLKPPNKVIPVERPSIPAHPEDDPSNFFQT